jgi:hypothetical protein
MRSAGNLHFTLRNEGQERRKVTVRVELGNSGAGRKDLNRIAATETLSGQNLSLKGTGKEGTVEFEIPLEPADTAVAALDR